MADSEGKPLEQVVRRPEWCPPYGASGGESEGIKEPVSSDFRRPAVGRWPDSVRQLFLTSPMEMDFL